MKPPCCQVAQNLETRIDTMRPDIVIQVCHVCGAKHIRLKAEPGVLGMRGADLGHAS